MGRPMEKPRTRWLPGRGQKKVSLVGILPKGHAAVNGSVLPEFRASAVGTVGPSQEAIETSARIAEARERYYRVGMSNRNWTGSQAALDPRHLPRIPYEFPDYLRRLPATKPDLRRPGLQPENQIGWREKPRPLAPDEFARLVVTIRDHAEELVPILMGVLATPIAELCGVLLAHTRRRKAS